MRLRSPSKDAPSLPLSATQTAITDQVEEVCPLRSGHVVLIGHYRHVMIIPDHGSSASFGNSLLSKAAVEAGTLTHGGA